jgi:hypothetical protein
LPFNERNNANVDDREKWSFTIYLIVVSDKRIVVWIQLFHHQCHV